MAGTIASLVPTTTMVHTVPRASLFCAAAPYEAQVGALPDTCGGLPLLIGPVMTGFGRGSRKLGIPTANLPCSLFQAELSDLPCGVYAGWAGVRGGVHKCVCNVGFSPTFEGAENPEKIVEAHLMEEFETDFYGEQMRLLLLGFLRPERKFGGVDELLATIRADIQAAGDALESSPLADFQALVAALPMLGDKPSYTLLEIPAGVEAAPATTEADVTGNGKPDTFAAPPDGFEWGQLY